MNVRGLRDYQKFRKIHNWLIKHDSNKGITFLQETHSQTDVENDWSKRTRGKLIMSHGTTNSKGTAILFGNELNYILKEEIVDNHGRFIIVLTEIQGKNFILIFTEYRKGPNISNERNYRKSRFNGLSSGHLYNMGRRF